MSGTSGNRDNNEKGQITRFESREDFAKRRALRAIVENAEKAVDCAYAGRGEEGTPNQAQKETLENARVLLGMLLRDLGSRDRPIPEMANETADKIMKVKIILAPYLSSQQFVEYFGTDNLA